MTSAPATWTQKGIAAVKAGNRSLALQFLRAAVRENPDDELAWLWMSGVVTTSEEKRECLERVLAINPDNAAAKRGMAILGSAPAVMTTVSAPEPVPIAPPPVVKTPVVDEMPARSAANRAKTGGGRRIVLVGLGVLATIVVIAVIAALAGLPPSSAPVVSGGPSGTRPPTWTPTPTPQVTLTPTPRPAPEQLQPLVNEAVRVRELEPILSIHYVTAAQFDIDLYLRNDVDSQAVTLANTFWNQMRALGLVDYALEYDRQRIIDLTARRIAGFYSPADKTLYAVTESSRVDSGEYVVIVHEYAHALTDMHFDLGRLLSQPRTTDADLAARALVEGDATLVENMTPWAYYEPDGWEQYAADARAAVPLYRQMGASAAFLFIQSFPYAEGWRFAWSLREESGWERVDQAYSRVPQSTEQILHPERYLADSDSPKPVALPDIQASLLEGLDQVAAQDTLGEFVLSVYLDEFIRDGERARRAAEGWGGDAFRAWVSPASDSAYVWLIAWDSEADASEFIAPMAEVLSARSGANPPTGPGIERIFFDGDRGEAYISRNGDQVLVVWSSKDGLRDEILEAFPDF